MTSQTTVPQIDPANATLAWDQLSTQVDALIGAWQAGERPPTLSRFLPAQPLELRRLVLVELVKVDLEYRWQQHKLPKTIEEYVAEFPELTEANGLLPTDLIYEEYHVRRQTAEPPDPSEFLRRFPREADQLRRMLDLQGGQTSTLAVGSRKRPLDIGNQIDDFDVLTRLGEGAFASVYLARQRSMHRLVALKVSRDQGTEPQTLAQLDHANIVRVYDQRIIVEQRLRLLYMQHVPGGTLQDVVQEARNSPFTLWSGKTLLAAVDRSLEKHGESPPAESSTRRRLAAATWPEAICWLGARLAAALDYAHRRGVLHRDVKPANVLLSAEGMPKLADFNVSFSSKLDGATPAAYFGGSLAYMSPEQLEASDPDHSREPDELDGRSDLYSLAVMLWELLTGTRPFGEERIASSMSETLKQLAARRRAGVPSSAVAALPSDLPGGLKEILLACLAPDPANRPADGAEVARQLELCLRPRAQGLFRPKPGSFREMLRKYPVWIFILAGVVPHGVVSYVNTRFNSKYFIEGLEKGESKSRSKQIDDIFDHQVWTINGVSYSLGIGYGLYLAWPVLASVGRYRRGRPPDPAQLPFLRRRSLVIGDYVTWLGFGLWFISGVVFPVWLIAALGYDESKGQLYWYFFLSQIICGLIASTQTFFQFTFVTVRGFHPLLVQLDRTDLDEIDQLLRLDRRLNWYLGLAIAAPFIAFFALGLAEFTNIRLATIGLAVIGIVSCYFAWRTLRNIQGDIGALLTAMDPERAASPSSIDTIESFWTSSR